MMKAKGRRHPDVDADDQQGSEEHHFLKLLCRSVVGDTSAGIDVASCQIREIQEPMVRPGKWILPLLAFVGGAIVSVTASGVLSMHGHMQWKHASRIPVRCE